MVRIIMNIADSNMNGGWLYEECVTITECILNIAKSALL
jgi:hypothetical protein